MTKPRRADPLGPDARRRAIIEAVAPLLVERGASVTTRQMAQAAGIAEGTLFSVFPDKASVILATIEQRMNPEPLRAALAAIDPEAPLEARLEAAGRPILACLTEIMALGTVLRTLPHRHPPRKPKGPPGFMKTWGEAATMGLTVLLEPHRARLRLAPEGVAGVFLGLLFASRWPPANPAAALTLDQAIDVLLHGVTTPEGSP